MLSKDAVCCPRYQQLKKIMLTNDAFLLMFCLGHSKTFSSVKVIKPPHIVSYQSRARVEKDSKRIEKG